MKEYPGLPWTMQGYALRGFTPYARCGPSGGAAINGADKWTIRRTPWGAKRRPYGLTIKSPAPPPAQNSSPPG
eukprot:8525739-Alexandrium_andersonii.AAC.1